MAISEELQQLRFTGFHFKLHFNGEECLALGLLLQPTADFVEQGVLLPVDVPAGGVVGPPCLVPFGLQPPQLSLEFKLLRQVGSHAGGFLRLLDLLVEFLKLGLQGSPAVVGPAVELVHLGIEPVAVLGGQCRKELGLPAGCRVGKQTLECRRDCRGSRYPARKIEQSPASGFVQGLLVVGDAGQDQRVFALQRLNAEPRTGEPSAFADEGCECGDVLAAAGVVENHFGRRRGQGHCLGQDPLGQRMADAVGVRVFDVLAKPIRAGMDRLAGERIAGEVETVLVAVESA